MVKSFNHFKKLLDAHETTPTAPSAAVETQPQAKHINESELFSRNAILEKDETFALDTVGAVVLDSQGHFASAVSSGGILLKHPGRVGHASMFGCGCWVEEDIVDPRFPGESMSVAACTTGCGEYIIKTLFARECSHNVAQNREDVQYGLEEFFKNKFFEAPLIKKYADKFIGAMICKLDTFKNDHDEIEKALELIVAHTTPSMCFGYMSSSMYQAATVMSRMGDEEKSGDNVIISNFRINLNEKIEEQTAEKFFKRNKSLVTDEADSGGNVLKRVKA